MEKQRIDCYYSPSGVYKQPFLPEFTPTGSFKQGGMTCDKVRASIELNSSTSSYY
jgi:hypothetical protein